MSRPTIRTLAVLAFAGQVAFIVSWIVAGALEPGYSHVHQGVSELGAHTAAHPWIVNAGIVALGLSFVVLAFALRPVLPRRRSSDVAAGLFLAAGAVTAAIGPLNLDCELAHRACRAALDAHRYSWHEAVHLWGNLATQLLLALTPFALARALRPSATAAAALGSGLFGLAFGLVSWFLYDAPGEGANGIVQRVGLFVVHSWVLIIAIGILWVTRSAPRPGRLVPLRPRDFMSGEWVGEGEFLLRPFWIGRRFAGRFRARRVTKSISETVWLFDDEIELGDGRAMQRRTFLEFVSDNHARLTAADLPDGGDLWFEDDGYRIAPFRMAFPIGPVPVHVRVEDTSYLEPDGTFVNQYDARELVTRIPIARTTFRVHPVATAEYSRASASAARPASSAASPASG